MNTAVQLLSQSFPIDSSDCDNCGILNACEELVEICFKNGSSPLTEAVIWRPSRIFTLSCDGRMLPNLMLLLIK